MQCLGGKGGGGNRLANSGTGQFRETRARGMPMVSNALQWRVTTSLIAWCGSAASMTRYQTFLCLHPLLSQAFALCFPPSAPPPPPPASRPVGAASCRRDHHTMASCQNPPPPCIPCGVHYLWFAFVCILIRSHPLHPLVVCALPH